VRACEHTRVELALPGAPPVQAPLGKPRHRPVPARRHYLGVEVGGTGFLQVMYRFRPVGPLLLEGGLMAVGLNGAGIFQGSAGLLLDIPIEGRVSVLTGAGVTGVGVLGGEGDSGAAYETWGYGYARAGLGFRVGLEQADQLGLEVAFWRGSISDNGAAPREFWAAVPGVFWVRAL
jgi:hypothetical protein